MRHASHTPALPVTMTNDEAALVGRVAQGDKDAFSDLYDRVAGTVYGLARRIVTDPHLAEDVTQEVLVQIWRQADRFDPSRGSVRAWILTVTHRRAVDAVRREQAARDRSDRVAADVGSAPDPVADTVAEAAEHASVRAALEGLTEIQRESLLLAYYGGLTHREISERLGLPLGTAKTRLRDAIARLRTTMEASS